MSVAVSALMAAFLFGLSVHLQHAGMRYMDAQSGILVNIFTAALVVVLAAPWFFELDYLWTRATLLFVLIGLVQPALTMTLSTWGIKYLGPSISSSIAATNPVFALYLAWLFLGEDVTPLILVGTSLVVTGVVIASYRGRRVIVTWPLWCLLLPLGAAFFRALMQPLTKIGLAEVPSPLYALLVTAVVSCLVLGCVHLIRGNPLPSRNPGYWWFAGSGALGSAGVFFYNNALNDGDVIVVAPIVATAPVMAVLLSQFVFRKEIISPRTWITIILVSAGVMLVL